MAVSAAEDYVTSGSWYGTIRIPSWYLSYSGTTMVTEWWYGMVIPYPLPTAYCTTTSVRSVIMFYPQLQ